MKKSQCKSLPNDSKLKKKIHGKGDEEPEEEEEKEEVTRSKKNGFTAIEIIAYYAEYPLKSNV